MDNDPFCSLDKLVFHFAKHHIYHQCDPSNQAMLNEQYQEETHSFQRVTLITNIFLACDIALYIFVIYIIIYYYNDCILLFSFQLSYFNSEKPGKIFGITELF